MLAFVAADVAVGLLVKTGRTAEGRQRCCEDTEVLRQLTPVLELQKPGADVADSFSTLPGA